MKSNAGVTALQQASGDGHSEIVDLLLAAGASVNACALSNTTALYNAAAGGHLEVTQKLLRAGGDIDLQTTSGATSLQAAAGGGFVEVGQLLSLALRHWRQRVSGPFWPDSCGAKCGIRSFYSRARSATSLNIPKTKAAEALIWSPNLLAFGLK